MTAALVVAASALGVLDVWPRLQLRSRWLTVAASFIGLVPVLLGAACLLLLVALRGRWRLLAAALALALIVLVVVRTSRPAGAGSAPANLVVLALNTYYGWADPKALAAEAAATGADVVVLPEVTTRTLAGLGRTDWDTRFPHRVGTPAGDWNDSGLMVFSRFPLTLTAASPRRGIGLRVDVARPQGPLTLIGVHFANPQDDWPEWTADFSWLRDAVAGTSAAPVIVAGDFNAVPQHEQFRALLQRAGLSDAAEDLGEAWSPTFPSWRSYPPPASWEIPVLPLDHVLTGPGVSPAALSTFRVDGTDHRGLVARLHVG